VYGRMDGSRPKRRLLGFSSIKYCYVLTWYGILYKRTHLWTLSRKDSSTVNETIFLNLKKPGWKSIPGLLKRFTETVLLRSPGISQPM
jgi:hypothetical protein